MTQVTATIVITGSSQLHRSYSCIDSCRKISLVPWFNYGIHTSTPHTSFNTIMCTMYQSNPTLLISPSDILCHQCLSFMKCCCMAYCLMLIWNLLRLTSLSNLLRWLCSVLHGVHGMTVTGPCLLSRPGVGLEFLVNTDLLLLMYCSNICWQCLLCR